MYYIERVHNTKTSFEKSGAWPRARQLGLYPAFNKVIIPILIWIVVIVKTFGIETLVIILRTVAIPWGKITCLRIKDRLEIEVA